MASNERGQSSSFGRQKHEFDPTPLPPLGTATITRSMSRKSLSAHQSLPKQQPSTITKSSTLKQSTARPSITSARRLSTSNSSTSHDPRLATDNPTKKRQIRPIGSATSSSGMGVRKGPAVVRSVSSMARHEQRVERRSLSPAKLSPAKLAQPSLSTSGIKHVGSNDPFSVNFRYGAVGDAVGEKRSEGGRKRSIGDVEEVDGTATAGGMRKTKSIKGVLSERSGELPAKRLHVAEEQQIENKVLTADKPSTTRTLSSPARARVRSRTRTQSDENAGASKPRTPSFDNYLSAPLGRTLAMELDNPGILASPSTISTEASRKESRGMNDSDDELDFISPRKKRAAEIAGDGERTDREAAGGIRSPIRSPMQRKRITSPIRSPPRLLEEGVPVSRIPQSLSSVVSSPLFAASVSQIAVPTLQALPIINSALPSASNSSGSTLPSKYARPSLPLGNDNVPSALATSQPMKRSGIPRLAAAFPPIYNPHQSSSTLPQPSRTLSRSTSTVPSSNNPPRRISNAALSSRYARSRDPNGDESMTSNSTLLFETAPTTGGRATQEEEVGNISVADETASRLANLQAMLSRLAMPRQSLAGVSMGGTSFIPEKRIPSSVSSATTSTSHLEKQRERRRTTMTGSFREEYTMPLSGGAGGGGEMKMGPPKGTGRHVAGRASISGPTPSSSYASTRPSTLSRSTTTLPDLQKTVPAIVSSSSRGNDGVPVASTSSHIRAPRKSTLLPSSSSTAILSSLVDNTHSKENAPPSSHPITTTVGGGGGGDTTMLDGRVQIPKHSFLKDVVAFVDVRTLEGDDAGMIFVDMLKSMSARVTTRPTPSLTHIIYKSGRPSTLTRYKASPANDRPFLVGISWVVRCAEVGKRVDEGPYLVQEGKEGLTSRRRKSMEPRLIVGVSGSGSGSGVVGGAGGGRTEIGAIGNGIKANTSALQATIAASIDRVRRKSLQFQPKIGSPLAKRVFTMSSTLENDEEMF